MPAPSNTAPAPAPLPVSEPPRSAAHFGLSLAGLAGGLGIMLALLHWGPALDALIGPLPAGMGTIVSNHLLVAVAGCLAVFLIIGIGELLWQRSYRNASTGLAPARMGVDEVAVYLSSMVGSAAIMAALLRGNTFQLLFGGMSADLAGVLAAAVGVVTGLLVVVAAERLWRRGRDGVKAWDLGRIATRVFGLVLTLLVVAFVYWLFQEYHGNFYDPWWAYLETLLGPVAVLVIPYFVWTDQRLLEPRDAYWHLGYLPYAALRHHMDRIDGGVLAAHFKAWTVKCFFLALMVVYLNGNVGELGNALSGFLAQPGPWYTHDWYHFLYYIGYTVDLLFCVVGYTITLRLFDSHIRSTEPTTFGWIIALLCYMPFYRTIGDMYLNYDDSIYWNDWLAPVPWLRNMWGAAIIMLVFIYGLATVAFGLRFSNLTYRGVITNGPYRYTKHPAYLSKNLSWWLISVPWVWENGHFFDAVRHCFLLALLNLVYYLRARTEENHLSLRDPDYVAYALWMEENGIMSWVGRLFPVFRYKPPTAAALAAAQAVELAAAPVPAKAARPARAAKR